MTAAGALNIPRFKVQFDVIVHSSAWNCSIVFQSRVTIVLYDFFSCKAIKVQNYNQNFISCQRRAISNGLVS